MTPRRACLPPCLLKASLIILISSICSLHSLIDMASFLCRHCSTSLNTLEQAIDHVHSLHRLFAKQCVVPSCGQWVNKLTKHVKSSHPSLCSFSCNLCSRPFVKERSLEHHQQYYQRKAIDCTKKKQRIRRKRNKPKKKKQDTVTYTSSRKKYIFLPAENYIPTV